MGNHISTKTSSKIVCSTIPERKKGLLVVFIALDMKKCLSHKHTMYSAALHNFSPNVYILLLHPK